MKPTTTFSLALVATAVTATASNVHAVAELIVRAMDPTTMDPTKFSVLSVLKTAVPSPTGTATDIILPTGDIAPQWYKDLPADVMVLLAQMYPATPTAAVSGAASLAANMNSSSIQDAAALSTAASQTTLTSSIESASVTLSAATNSTGYSNVSTVTSTGSSCSNTTNCTFVSTSATVVPTIKPGLELPGKSAGAKVTVGTGTLSTVMGLGVAAAFCLFA